MRGIDHRVSVKRCMVERWAAADARFTPFGCSFRTYNGAASIGSRAGSGSRYPPAPPVQFRRVIQRSHLCAHSSNHRRSSGHYSTSLWPPRIERHLSVLQSPYAYLYHRPAFTVCQPPLEQFHRFIGFPQRQANQSRSSTCSVRTTGAPGSTICRSNAGRNPAGKRSTFTGLPLRRTDRRTISCRPRIFRRYGTSVHTIRD